MAEITDKIDAKPPLVFPHGLKRKNAGCRMPTNKEALEITSDTSTTGKGLAHGGIFNDQACFKT